MAVTYSGSASVHHSSDTNASNAAQLRFSGASSNIGAAVHVGRVYKFTQHQRKNNSWPTHVLLVQTDSQSMDQVAQPGRGLTFSPNRQLERTT